MRVTFLLFLMASTAHAQIQVAGPKASKTKEAVALTFKTEAKQLKVLVEPENNSWRLGRNYEDPNTIEIYFTPTENQTYTFFIAGNLEGKTIVGKHTIKIDGSQPQPQPGPQPQPKPDNPYADKIKASYLVSPDAEQLADLIKIYKTIVNSNYSSWETCQSDLKERASTNKLTNVKKQVAEFLTADAKNPYSAELKDKIFGQIVSALEEIK